MLSDYLPWIVAGAVVLALVIGGVVMSRVAPDVTAPLRRRRPRPHRGHFRPEEEQQTPVRQAAVIINPTKVTDLGPVRERITATCRANGWGEPLFLETTAEDPGPGQAATAVRHGVDLVCTLGGDGTVRNVASVLVGTEMPLGILPAGTGNLLARNLDLPVGLEAALTVALTGRNRRIDVGELRIGPLEPAEHPEAGPDGAAASAQDEPISTPTPQTHHFLVMSGIGMDAAIMAGTNENLKNKVGWPAYLVSGAKHLISPEFRVTVRVDDEPEFRRRSRMVVIGNCGRLLGGLVLMPSALVDDGHLDAVIASPRGLVGWVPVATRVATRRRKGHPTLDHKVCTEIRVVVDRPVPVQVDGDVLGEATEVTAVVRPASLTVRVSRA
ncbi:diacylglycerol/lipid kinase family protein [Humibacillus xanthopallidus]|uniref:Diacylglycerol kinase family enzyme n=1 Tax=Humibacillus xanthopallidus TaxID=412689 RepID=A0A543I2X0_9MICO|nr:diacylglycerol kinase family protein [Humibacillus xanthopallidus]TQM64891.1 diacylglycerol kinase family enzyme [Humibacillus xanthopallidus]